MIDRGSWARIFRFKWPK